MGRATAMSNHEVRHLFEEWGFEPAGGNGGHLIMRWPATNRRVQITAPGRSTPTPMRALAKAAHTVGVPLSEFKQGPPPDTTAVPDDVTHTNGHQRPAPPATIDLRGTHHDDHSPDRTEPEPVAARDWCNDAVRPSERIVAYLRDSGRPRTKADIVDATRLEPTQVSAALSYLYRTRGDTISRPRRGTYQYDTTTEDRAAAAAQREHDLAEAAAAHTAANTFTRLGEDRHGRIVLNGPDGELYIAIRAEPGFHPLR